MIQARNIDLAFGGQKVFDDISFNLSDDQKIGLVGLNGSGKSTLLKAIAGQQVLDSGRVSTVNNKTIAYDLAYSNKPTAFMQWCKNNGSSQCFDGMGMLVEQAAEAFFIWRKVKPAVIPAK